MPDKDNGFDSLIPNRRAVSVALKYFIIAALWIFFSDRFFSAFSTTIEKLVWMQTFKGWFFVLVSALFIYYLVFRDLRLQRSLYQDFLHRREEALQKQWDTERLLHETEVRYGNLFSKSMDAILFADRDGRIIQANEAACSMFGYRPEEILTLKRHDLMEASIKLEQAVTERDHHGYFRGELGAIRKNGESFIAEVSSAKYQDKENHTVFFSIIRDITEARLVQENLESANRNLRFLSSGIRAVLIAQEEEELLLQVCRIAVDIGEYDMAWIGFAENDDKKSIRPAAYAGESNRYLEKIQFSWGGDESGRGPVGSSVRGGKTVYCANTLTDLSFGPWTTHASRFGFRSLIAIPLRVEENAIGTFVVYSSQPEAFSSGKQVMLEELAENLSYGIRSIRGRDELDKASQVARLNAQRLELALAGAELAMWTWNIQTGELYLEERWGKMLGYEHSELKMHFSFWKNLVHPDDLPGVTEALDRHLKGESDVYETEHRLLTKAGDYKWILDRGKVVEWDGEGKPLQAAGTHLDITGKKNAEEMHEKLRKERDALLQRLQIQIERMPIGYIVTDSSFRFTYINPAAEKIFGYKNEEVKGKSVYGTILSPDSKGLMEGLIGRIGNGEEIVEMTNQNLTKAGNMIVGEWINTPIFDESGELDSLLCMVQDVTRRLEAEEALQASRQRYQVLFEESPIPIWEEDMSAAKLFMDRLKGEGLRDFKRYFDENPDVVKELAGKIKILGVNGAAVKFHQADSKKDLMKTLHVISVDDTYRSFKEEFVRIARNETSFSLEAKVKNLRNDIHDVMIFFAVVQGHSTKYDRVIVSILDITERNKIISEMENSRQQLRALAAHLQSIREQERTNIAREMHDELGQLLTALKMDLSMLSDDVIEKTGDMTPERVVEEITAMTSLVDQTISQVRKLIRELRPEALDNLGLFPAIEWLVDEFRSRYHIDCELTLQADSPELDQEREIAVFRIIQEALTNVARHSKATKATVVLRQIEDMLEMAICDNGIGIPPEKLEDKNTFGLIGMKERAIVFGGNVEIGWDENHGTCVRIQIPVYI